MLISLVYINLDDLRIKSVNICTIITDEGINTNTSLYHFLNYHPFFLISIFMNFCWGLLGSLTIFELTFLLFCQDGDLSGSILKLLTEKLMPQELGTGYLFKSTNSLYTFSQLNAWE